PILGPSRPISSFWPTACGTIGRWPRMGPAENGTEGFDSSWRGAGGVPRAGRSGQEPAAPCTTRSGGGSRLSDAPSIDHGQADLRAVGASQVTLLRGNDSRD